MSDHDRTQELLAGYALRSLAGQDAADADRLLAEHVPACDDCRATLDAFAGVAGDLALAAEPVDPPELLLARIHRDMEPARRGGRLGTFGWVAAAAGFVALVTLGGLAIGGGDTSATLAASSVQQALAAAARPGAQTADVGAVEQVATADRSGFYLWGQDVPSPPPGQVYRLWLLADGQAYYVGSFAPDAAGVVAIHVQVEGSYDEVIVTTEDLALTPTQPSGAAWAVEPSVAAPAA